MINQVMLENLKPHWAASPFPFLTWQWHKTWNNVFGNQYEPFYLSVNNEIIAPFVKRKKEIIFSGGEEIADYLDLVGPDDKKVTAWKEIIPYCTDNGITSISLRNVPQNSPTVEFFRKLPGATVKKEDTTPIVSLPKTWKEFIESINNRKYRHELERKIKKFEREHKDTQIRESTHPAFDIDILFKLMKKDNAKKKFLTPDMKIMFRKIAAAFTDNISLLLLDFGKSHAAATLSFVSDNVSYLYNSGFDKTCCSNAGFYLKSMSIKRAIEKGYKHYNFLQGNERYKYELGGKDFFVYSIRYTRN
jgi:hypothetical protein